VRGAGQRALDIIDGESDSKPVADSVLECEL
jgi:hypothetical protein